MLYIAHTFIWLPVSFVLPNHTQFIPVHCMLCIAHAFIWLPVSFVPPHRKQLIELNRMPFIADATKTRTVFDASVIANVLYISDGFHTAPFAIMASHTVSRRVSDCSVALAASCSSARWVQPTWARQERGARPGALCPSRGPSLVVLGSTISLLFHKKSSKVCFIPRTFISAQKQHHGSSVENCVSPGLVSFKSCKLESKTREKDFGK